MATLPLASPTDFKTGRIAPLNGGSRRLPPILRAASGFSERRFCRIFPRDDLWVLQMEQGGWSLAPVDQGRKTFPTLTAAIIYAVAHGLNYRVVHAPAIPAFGERRPALRALEKISRPGIDGRGAVSNS